MSEQIIGAPVRRVDGRLKVTGAARYTADQHLDGMVHAYGVFSTIASGVIVEMELDEARKSPGVIDIFHHEHSSRLYRVPKSPLSFDRILTASIVDEHRLPFEDATVYYAGQFVALVVADTFEHAREAAYKVKVHYEKKQAVANLAQGLAAHDAGDGGSGHERGEPQPAFDAAPYRVDAVYTTPVETHNPMEMHATVARWVGAKDGAQDEDELHVFEASQGVTVHRNTLANIFGLSPERVIVQAPFIGSGFGSKLWAWPHAIAACAAAREIGRPVKLVVPRSEMFTTTGHRPETRQHLRLAADANGRLVSLRHESINTTSFTDKYVEPCGGMSSSLYSCANVLVSHQTTEVNRGTPTSMRAPGAAPGLFALESAVDELAIAAGMDPLAFHLLNISERDESTHLPWSSNHLREACEQGAAAFGWAKRNPGIGAMRDGDEIIGYGMAACNWDAFRTPSEARVALKADGTACVTCAVQDIGTGTYTIAAQTIASLTGLPFERIEVKLGDSSFPDSTLSGGSWATASVLPAIAQAARTAIAQLKTFATQSDGYFAGARPEDLTLAGGCLIHGEQSVDFARILNQLNFAAAEGHARTPGAPSGKFSFSSFGAHFAEVRWDAGISRLRVSRVVSAIDVGRAINPMMSRNQVEGAIVMGIGMALFEGAEYDEHTGVPTNNNYAEYVVPVHADQPELEVILLDYPDFELNEFGARGIGEIGITGLAAAIANAVYHATGKRVRDLPITLDKLMD